MIRLVMLGPPGSGKGTYATRISPILKIPTISTGDLLRSKMKDPELGPIIKKYINSGQLVPDEIVFKVFNERLKKDDTKNGFILDGIPRTLEQAKRLENISKIDAVINLVVPEDVIIARLSSRRICKKCGAIYNLLYLKPKVEGICDKCGGELIQRDDDKPEVIKERLREYEKLTKPLIDYYGEKGIRVDIECKSVDIPPEVQVKKIIDALKERNLV